MGKRGKYTPVLLILPAFLLLFFLTLYPTIFTYYVSFTRSYIVQDGLGKPFVGVQNYVRIWTDAEFWNALMNTSMYVIVAVSSELILGFLLAFLLNRDLPGLRVFRLILITPMVLAPVAVAFMSLLLYDPELGLFNYVLSAFHLPTVNWTSSASTALLSIILVDIWQWTPFAMLIMYAGMRSLPKAPFEAAEIDGASPLRILLRIRIPLLRPFIIIALIFRVIDSLKVFDYVYAITYGGPGISSETLYFYAFKMMFNYFSAGYASAMSIILFLISMVITIIFMRWFTLQVRY